MTPPTAAGGRIMSIVVPLFLTILSTVAMLVLIELGGRFWVAKIQRSVMALDDELGWKHRPNASRTYSTDGVTAAVTTNALGLRGPIPAAESDRPRVLVLGDSFTDGLEVSDDELFTTVWNGLRPDLQIVNAGVGGYGTVQELDVLVRLAPVVRPSLCVLMVYANDLNDNVMPFYPTIGARPYVDRDGNPQPLSWDAFTPLLPPVPGASWLYRHSVVASLLQMRRLLAGPSPAAQRYIDRWERSLPDDDKWRVLEMLARRIGERCPCVLVSLPRREAVVAGDGDFARRLHVVADHLGAQFVDLQPVLRREDFYDTDIHWRASGHRAVARELATRILPR